MKIKKPARSYKRTAQPSKEKGVALVIALILLVIMTMLGLSAMRTVTLEEKMTGHTYDRSISFQATETALRQAEALVGSASPKPTPASGTGCTTGICGLAVATAKDRWEDAAFTGWANATPVTSGSITLTPQYIIEYLGNTFPCRPEDLTAQLDCKRYRITARSNAGDDRAVVMLQSTYATE